MLERLIVLVTAAALALVVGRLWQTWRHRRLSSVDAVDLATSVPTLLYFSADWCGQCRLQQRPIIERLLVTMSACFRLREVDVEREGDLAHRFGVVTLPTTVVIAPSGRVVARNTGVARWTQLDTQIQQALPHDEC